MRELLSSISRSSADRHEEPIKRTLQPMEGMNNAMRIKGERQLPGEIYAWLEQGCLAYVVASAEWPFVEDFRPQMTAVIRIAPYGHRTVAYCFPAQKAELRDVLLRHSMVDE
jgi:hypothetical protein